MDVFINTYYPQNYDKFMKRTYIENDTKNNGIMEHIKNFKINVF